MSSEDGNNSSTGTGSGPAPIPSRDRARPSAQDSRFGGSSTGPGTAEPADAGPGQPPGGPGAPAAVPPADQEQKSLRCVLIGPSKAGKTSFIDACEQACVDPAALSSPVRLEYLGGAETETQSERLYRILSEASYRRMGTTRTERSEAYLTATWPARFWRPAKRLGVHLSFTDGPGGALFPSKDDEGEEQLIPWHRQLIEESRQADAIILCVDSTSPQVDRTSRYLRNILAAIAQPLRIQPPLPPPGHRLLRQMGRASDPPATTLKRIRARRFLLMLTKIDRLASGGLDRTSAAARRAFRAPVPRAIASTISPLALACEILDPSNIVRILNAVVPDAEIAVALTSSLGFNAAGYPFAEDDVPVRLSTEQADRQSADWRPFGVREALLFVLDGQTRGPVERVTTQRIARAPRPVFDMPSWYFD
jgi:hypothetical protein